jgi:hypothetical protein
VPWRELEPKEGHYDFSVIDRGLAQARAAGGVFGFRIQAACTGCATGGIAVPDYLVNLMPKGFWFNLNGAKNYAPDWNDPDYLVRLDALLEALGKRYRNDPRLGFVDISSYGDFGEWHLHGWPYPAKTGAVPITLANARAIVDMNLHAFPTKRLLMQHQTVTVDGKTDHDVFLYALGKSSRIGIRNDCLGDPWFSTDMGDLYGKYSIVANRWKTAPVMTEYCYQSPGTGGLARASKQIDQYHVADIGNGNTAAFGEFSSTEQHQWKVNNTKAGYRFVVDRVAMVPALAAGNRFQIVANWSNVGVTPAYTDWTVTYELRNAKNRTVWREASSLDLDQFLPGTRTVTDTFDLGKVAPGRYRLVLAVRDPHRYYAPLALAIGDRARDGSYSFGTVEVHK